MTPTDLFSQRLRELREKKGLTQAELAAKLQISRKAISAYETGRAFPTAEGLEKMAKFFNLTLPIP